MNITNQYGLGSVQARQSEEDELSPEEERRIREDAESLLQWVASLPETPEEYRGVLKNVAEGLATDLSLLLESAKFCDVTLCAGGREFRAHRNILAARSPVFAAMFEHDMLEKAEGIVEIKDFDGDVINNLLQYIYTDCTAFEGSSSSVILSLLAAADKYLLPKLKEACSAYLRSNLTEDMALRVMVVADLHEDKDLKEAAVTTVLQNACHIMMTDDWMAFLKDYSQLANCVILRLLYNK